MSSLSPFEWYPETPIEGQEAPADPKNFQRWLPRHLAQARTRALFPGFSGQSTVAQDSLRRFRTLGRSAEDYSTLSPEALRAQEEERAFIAAIQERAQGTGTSPAEMAVRRAAERDASGARATAGSLRGVDAAVRGRTLGQQIAQIQTELPGQVAFARQREQQQAQDSLASLLAAARSGDIQSQKALDLLQQRGLESQGDFLAAGQGAAQGRLEDILAEQQAYQASQIGNEQVQLERELAEEARKRKLKEQWVNTVGFGLGTAAGAIAGGAKGAAVGGAKGQQAAGTLEGSI